MKDKNCNIFHTCLSYHTLAHKLSTLCVMTQESVVSLMSIFKITNFSALTGRPQTRSTAPWKL